MSETVKNFLLSKSAIILLIIGILIIAWSLFSKFFVNITNQNIPPTNISSDPLKNLFKSQSTTGYKAVWVKGKSLDECMGDDKELNENVMRCRSGYYEKVPTK